MLPLLIEDHEEAFANGITNRRRPARGIDRLGIPVERFVAEVFDEVANGGRSIPSQFDHGVERRSRLEVS